MKPIKCEDQTHQFGRSPSEQPLKIFGMNIGGIDPFLIKEASLEIEVPLNEGNREFIGLRKDAKLDIKKGTSAKISLMMAKNNKGILSIQWLSFSFNHAIAVKNPASSLQNGMHSSQFVCAIKDTLASVKLRNIVMADDGSVFVDGKVKALKFFKRPLPENRFNVDVSTLEDTFLEALGLIEQPADHQNNFQVLSERFNVRKVFHQLGAMTSVARYTLKIIGDSAPISLEKNRVHLEGPNRPLKINLSGEFSLGPEEILIKVNGNDSCIASSLGNFNTNANVAIKNIQKNKSVELDIHAEISGSAKGLHLDSFAKDPQNIGVVKRSVSGEQNSIDRFSILLGAKRTDIHTNIDVKAKTSNVATEAKGSFLVDIKVHDPCGRNEKSSVTMDGYLAAHLNMDEFSYDSSKKQCFGKGEMGFSIHPSPKTLAKFPELQTVSYRYGLEVLRDKKARISPPEYGFTRFLRPVTNFEGHNERIDHALTKGPLYTIGSPKYFEHIEKITGAELRSASEVKLLIDGVNSMPARLKIINEAQEYLCFQTLVFKDDESGWQYANALVNACRRGVKVYGIVDSLGNIESFKDIENDHPIYKFLRANGVKLQIYNGFLEEALRSIFFIIKKYPSVFTVKNPEHLADVSDMIKLFREITEEIEDISPRVEQQDKEKLCVALHTMLNGKKDVSPVILTNELRNALKKTTTLDHVLALIKRMGKLSFRAHEKYLVADHKASIVGGLNIAAEYLRGGNGDMVTVAGKKQLAWRDSDVLLAGDIAVEVFRNFRRNWCELSSIEMPPAPLLEKKLGMGDFGNSAVSLMQHRPMEEGDHKILNFLLYNLRTLKRGEKAWFETAYFLPRGALRILQKEMVLAAKRGVDVRILTNSETTSDFPALVLASVFDVRELLEAGARVFYRNKNRMVHAKVMVLGHRLTMMGSWNMDNRSASHDTEDMCAIFDAATTLDMIRVLRKDMHEQSRELSLKEMASRPWLQEIRSAGMLLGAEFV